MEKKQKTNREFHVGVKNSFLLGLPALALIYLLVNLESNRTRTTLLILSLFIVIELIPRMKPKRNKEYILPFLSGFLGGSVFLAFILWLMISHS